VDGYSASVGFASASLRLFFQGLKEEEEGVCFAVSPNRSTTSTIVPSFFDALRLCTAYESAAEGGLTFKDIL
jgi:hypothetical protein